MRYSYLLLLGLIGCGGSLPDPQVEFNDFVTTIEPMFAEEVAKNYDRMPYVEGTLKHDVKETDSPALPLSHPSRGKLARYRQMQRSVPRYTLSWTLAQNTSTGMTVGTWLC